MPLAQLPDTHNPGDCEPCLNGEIRMQPQQQNEDEPEIRKERGARILIADDDLSVLRQVAGLQAVISDVIKQKCLRIVDKA